MRLWRIATGLYPVWSGEGARRFGGRWNAPGQEVIYAALAYSTALLEVLVHANAGAPPSRARYVAADLPKDTPVERLDPAALPGWDDEDLAVPRRFAAAWAEAGKAAILLVPSAVTKLDLNAVVNPRHPAAAGIVVSPEAPVAWDRRLFRAR